MGLVATLMVHALALLFLLSSRVDRQIRPAPIVARVISAVPATQSKPEPLRIAPALDQPQLHLPLPDVALVDNTPAPSAAISVSSAAAPIAQAQQALDSVPSFDADYLDNPAPRYPPLSRRMREEGVVLLRVYVLPNGSADVVELKRSSGSARLDESALCAVQQWKFVPAQSAGRAVAAWVVVPIAFSLSV